MSYKLKKPITSKEQADFIVTYNHGMGLSIEETNLYLFALEKNEMMGTKIEGGVEIPYPVINPNYEQEEAEREQARIQSLYMTRSDFFDGTIRAFGADEDALLQAITAVLAPMPIEEVEKKIALNNYKNALNFYRKHPLFTMLSDVPIPIADGVTIQISSAQWDAFFVKTWDKNPNAYKELLPSNLDNE